MVDFSFIFSLYVSDLFNVTISAVSSLLQHMKRTVLIVYTLNKSETYKSTVLVRRTGTRMVRVPRTSPLQAVPNTIYSPQYDYHTGTVLVCAPYHSFWFQVNMYPIFAL